MCGIVVENADEDEIFEWSTSFCSACNPRRLHPLASDEGLQQAKVDLLGCVNFLENKNAVD